MFSPFHNTICLFKLRQKKTNAMPLEHVTAKRRQIDFNLEFWIYNAENNGAKISFFKRLLITQVFLLGSSPIVWKMIVFYKAQKNVSKNDLLTDECWMLGVRKQNNCTSVVQKSCCCLKNQKKTARWSRIWSFALHTCCSKSSSFLPPHPTPSAPSPSLLNDNKVEKFGSCICN